MLDFLSLIMIIGLLSTKGGEFLMDAKIFIICLIYIICCYVIKPLIERHKKNDDNK